MSASPETDLPIHVIFNIEKLGALPSIVKTKADSATCKAIAEYLGVDAVENFQSELAVRRWRRHGATVEGMIAADIVQPCVVTLEPVAYACKRNRLCTLPARTHVAAGKTYG